MLTIPPGGSALSAKAENTVALVTAVVGGGFSVVNHPSNVKPGRVGAAAGNRLVAFQATLFLSAMDEPPCVS